MKTAGRTIQMNGINFNNLLFNFSVLILIFFSAAELPNEAVGN